MVEKTKLMEQELKIPTSDDKYIYGKLRGGFESPLVIFVHGLGGLMDQHIYYNGSRYLEKHGVSSFRFNLYGWEKDARNLSECTLETHAFDLDRIVEFFRGRGIKKVFVIGHSFGAPTILLSQKKDFEGVILWDPSLGEPMSFNDAKYVKSLDMYKLRWNFELLIGKMMIEGSKSFQKREEEAIRKIKVPIKIITAGKGHLVAEGKRYFDLANKPKERVIIEKAGHLFDEDGVENILFKETLDWVKKYSN